MTKEMYRNLKIAFKTDYMPITAVGVSEDERVFVVAQCYESYLPTMPAGRRNRHYLYSGVFEMIDKGNYCALRDLKIFRQLVDAEIAFRGMAREMNLQVAQDNDELKKLLQTVTVDDARATA